MKPTRSIVDVAIEEAFNSTHRFRVGAVVYQRAYILGRGYNDALKTHPRSPHPYRTIHAEFASILNGVSISGYDSMSNGVSIYVHRVKLDGTPGLAMPCKWCMQMLTQMNIRDIHWSV